MKKKKKYKFFAGKRALAKQFSKGPKKRIQLIPTVLKRWIDNRIRLGRTRKRSLFEESKGSILSKVIEKLKDGER